MRGRAVCLTVCSGALWICESAGGSIDGFLLSILSEMSVLCNVKCVYKLTLISASINIWVWIFFITHVSTELQQKWGIQCGDSCNCLHILPLMVEYRSYRSYRLWLLLLEKREELAERDCISNPTAYCTSAYWISENNSDSFDIKVKVTRSLFVVVNHHEETRQNEIMQNVKQPLPLE